MHSTPSTFTIVSYSFTPFQHSCQSFPIKYCQVFSCFLFSCVTTFKRPIVMNCTWVYSSRLARIIRRKLKDTCSHGHFQGMKCDVLPHVLIVCFPDCVWTSESVTSVRSAESFNGLKGLAYLAKWKMKREVEEHHQSTSWWWAKNYRKVSQWDHTQAQTMNVLHTNTLITSLFPCWKTDVWQIVSVCVSHRLWLLASIGWITR